MNKNNLHHYVFLILLLPVFVQQSLAGDHQIYFDAGIGHNLNEQNVVSPHDGKLHTRSSPTAKFALGYRNVKWNTTIALDHDSSFLDGAPFNNRFEYHRTQIQIVKRFNLLEFGKKHRCRTSSREKALELRVEQLNTRVVKLMINPGNREETSKQQLKLAVEHIKRLKAINSELKIKLGGMHDEYET